MTPTIAHQALYRRWRAQTFSQIVGQEAVVETLRNAVRLDRVSHAILFVGPRGTGKTSLARILAKALNCTDLRDGDPCDACEACAAIREGRAMDLVEIDAASNRGIDAIRELRERIHYAPADLRRKVYILDEAHQITKDAWNALLKSLEEPPESVVFMFASTHPQEFPPAILSRLQRFDVRRLTVPEIEGKLTRILEADGRDAEPAALHLIARLAAGGMRDAESMLDQLLASAGERLDEPRVRDLLGLAESDAIDGFVDALVAGDAAAGIAVLDSLDERGRDARVFLDQVVEALRAALVAALGGAGQHPVTGLAAAARRLAAIDPNRAGTGGLRLQLELALFADAGTGAGAAGSSEIEGPSPVASVSPAATSMAADATDRRPAGSQPAHQPRVPRASSPAPAGPAPAAPAPAAPAPAAPAPAAAASATPAPEPLAPDTEGGSAPTPATAGALPAAAPPSAPAPRAPDDLIRLRDRWAEVVARISQHPPTKPLIGACRPISVEGNVVTLGFPEDQAFLRDVAERRRPILEEGIGAFLGRPVTVRCIATNLDLVPAPQPDGEAGFVLAEARKIFADDLVDVGEVS